MSVHIRSRPTKISRQYRRPKQRQQELKTNRLRNEKGNDNENQSFEIPEEEINEVYDSDPEKRETQSIRLPPIGKHSEENFINQSKGIQIPNYPIEMSDAEDTALKHNLSLKLELISKETLQSAHHSLQLSDNRNSGVQTVKELQHQFKRYHIPVSGELFNQLISKYISHKYPSFIDYNRMMGFLIHIKKLPVLNLAHQKLEQTSTRKKAHWKPTKWTYLKQEEIPILEELKRQFKESSVDVAMLYLHANEIDRGFKGVLTKAQVRRLLDKGGVHLTDNLLDSMLHYCDRDGYRLYSIEKLLDYFDRAVQEDRSFFKNNRRPARVTRVPSPTPPSPLPILQRSMSPIPLPPPTRPIPASPPPQPLKFENMQFEEIEPPFDREEWLKRFNFMARAINNCHQDLQGFLSVDEVEHITKTYNLVYNLDIPNSVITQCITQSYNSQNYLVDIRQYVYVLQSLCLQLAKFN